ncbi:MAG: Sec-independent protein translocase protein TatB [Myxococcaceae bacterium]
MFNIGAGELVVILVVALLVLGPKRLPEMARGIGKFLREFRRQTDEVRSVVEREFYRMDQDEAKANPLTSMPAPKPTIRPLSLPYRGSELRPTLGAAGPVLAKLTPEAPAAEAAAAEPPAPQGPMPAPAAPAAGPAPPAESPSADPAPPEGSAADPKVLH